MQLAKIKKTDPEGIFLPAFPENVGLILKQAKELGIHARWFSWNIEGSDVTAIAGSAANGIIYSSTAFEPDDQSAQIGLFVKNFQAKYGKLPNIYAATAYDGISILTQAICETDGSGSSIKNYLYGMDTHAGVSGMTKFDSDGMSKKDVIFKTIKNGRFVRYENVK